MGAENGIDVPESVVDAAVAAQEVRGAGGNRPGRSGDDDSEVSYEEEPKENQNLLNLLYLIAEVHSKCFKNLKKPHISD